LEVQFKSRTLEFCYLEYRKAQKKWGEEIARKYIQRIDIIQNTRNLDELLRLPALRCHALKGNRNGQYAVKLTGFYRLIFRMEGDQLEIVTIEEVSKHYGD